MSSDKSSAAGPIYMARMSRPMKHVRSAPLPSCLCGIQSQVFWFRYLPGMDPAIIIFSHLNYLSVFRCSDMRLRRNGSNRNLGPDGPECVWTQIWMTLLSVCKRIQRCCVPGKLYRGACQKITNQRIKDGKLKSIDLSGPGLGIWLSGYF